MDSASASLSDSAWNSASDSAPRSHSASDSASGAALGCPFQLSDPFGRPRTSLHNSLARLRMLSGAFAHPRTLPRTSLKKFFSRCARNSKNFSSRFARKGKLNFKARARAEAQTKLHFHILKKINALCSKNILTHHLIFFLNVDRCTRRKEATQQNIKKSLQSSPSDDYILIPSLIPPLPPSAPPLAACARGWAAERGP